MARQAEQIRKPATCLTELPEAEIRRLVEGLNSLREGELAVYVLVACGERAIPPLREFLLHGRPSVVHEPRRRAVRALAELGAKDVLVDYLRMPKPIADAAVRFGEEAVENAAAQALGNWQTQDAFEVLLEVGRSRVLPGVVEALGRFGRSEAIPYLITALGDDVARRDAEHSLRSLGEGIRTALIEAARTPDPSRREESPSSLARRRSALRILASLWPKAETWLKVQPLLRDEDAEIAVSAAAIALKLGADTDKDLAVQRLIQVLPGANWLLQSEIESCLLEYFPVAGPFIHREIRQRTQLAASQRAKDATLCLLLNVVRQGEVAQRH